MRSIGTALTFLLMIGSSAEAGKVERNTRCLVEVLHSEELAIAPLFYHTIRTTLLITAPHALSAETTVYKVVPWQAPPPRQGQKVWMECNRIAPSASFGHFSLIGVLGWGAPDVR